MPLYATAAAVNARHAYLTISASSSPTTAQVEAWLDFAEAQIRAVLASGGHDTVYAGGSDAALLIAEAAIDYADGRLANALASVEGDEENQPGNAGLARFDEFLEDIRLGRTIFAQELAAGPIAEARLHTRSHVTDTAGKLESDYAGVFRVDGVLD